MRAPELLTVAWCVVGPTPAEGGLTVVLMVMVVIDEEFQGEIYGKIDLQRDPRAHRPADQLQLPLVVQQQYFHHISSFHFVVAVVAVIGLVVVAAAAMIAAKHVNGTRLASKLSYNAQLTYVLHYA